MSRARPPRDDRRDATIAAREWADKQGYSADITIFDPADLKDPCDLRRPAPIPTGGRTKVLVNGVVVIEDARHTGLTPGTVLRRAAGGTVG